MKKIETFLAVIPVCRVKLEHLKMLTLEKISQINDLTVQLQTIEIEEQINSRRSKQTTITKVEISIENLQTLNKNN